MRIEHIATVPTPNQLCPFPSPRNTKLIIPTDNKWARHEEVSLKYSR